MIWHIFKKDWKLLWPFVVGVGAVHFSVLATMLQTGHFQNRPLANEHFDPGIDHYSLTYVLPLLAALASAFLIATIVHQEAIPGVRQDWLVRPIKRRDLLLAKILSVAIMVQASIFIADLIGGLVNGFPIAQAADAAVGRSVYLWLTLTFPALAFVSLMRNIVEGIVGAAIIFFVEFCAPASPPA
jgi:ABC-type transport system involved in multi-copper enzyme maturation permease subunit